MSIFAVSKVPPMGGSALCFLDVSTRFEQSWRAVGRSVLGVANRPCGTVFGDWNHLLIFVYLRQLEVLVQPAWKGCPETGMDW